MADDIRLDEGLYSLIHAVVREIPHGKVASYGQVARIAGHGIQARQVGYALASLKSGAEVPWQRVINSQGQNQLERCQCRTTAPSPGSGRDLF